MVKSMVGILVLSACWLTPKAQPTPAPVEIEWRTPSSLQQQLRVQSRPILVKVYTSWCVYCRQMDEQIWKHKAVATYVQQHFLVAKFDGEQKDSVAWQGETYGFNPKYGINMLTSKLLDGNITYPGMLLLSPDGNKIVINGARKLAEIEALLKFVATQAYKTNSFEQWQATFTPVWN